MSLLLVLTALIVVHGMFVAAEYAIVKMANFDELSVLTSLKSDRALRIFTHLEEYLTVCQLAKTMVLLTMGLLLGLFLSGAGMGDTAAIPELSWKQIGWFSLGFIGIVVVQLILGFELPRRIAVGRSEHCTEALGRQLILCRWFLWPILTIVKRINCSLTLPDDKSI